jgi:DNA-binding MarR family transcriptional regulator
MTRQDSPPPRPSGESPARSELDREAEAVTMAVMSASRLLLVAISARALASTGESPTLPQLRALVVLDTCGPVKLAALATTLRVTPSTALRMVGRLESAGHIGRRSNPDNRREVILRLTPSGRDLVARVLAHRRTGIRTLVEKLPAEARAGLVPALKALIQAAPEMAVDPFDETHRMGGLIDDPLSPAPPEPPGEDGVGRRTTASDT